MFSYSRPGTFLVHIALLTRPRTFDPENTPAENSSFLSLNNTSSTQQSH